MNLEKLRQREAKLKEQIKAAQAAQEKRDAALYREKCRIVGAAVLEEMEEKPELAEKLKPVFDARIKTPKGRRVMGLKPLPAQKKKKAVVADKPETVKPAAPVSPTPAAAAPDNDKGKKRFMGFNKT